MTDAERQYADIISLPHHRSLRHAPMPRADRAAQFSAFAALSGHHAALDAAALRCIEESDRRAEPQPPHDEA